MFFLKKGKKIYSVLMNKCPCCHKVNFWKYNNPYRNIFLKSEDQNFKCSNCSLKYEIEVGFWYGAMYISYALGVAIMVFGWILSNILFQEINITYEILFISLFLILVSPINYFYSRLIWINIFVKYTKE
jgi:hypothetical protein